MAIQHAFTAHTRTRVCTTTTRQNRLTSDRLCSAHTGLATRSHDAPRSTRAARAARATATCKTPRRTFVKWSGRSPNADARRAFAEARQTLTDPSMKIDGPAKRGRRAGEYWSVLACGTKLETSTGLAGAPITRVGPRYERGAGGRAAHRWAELQSLGAEVDRLDGCGCGPAQRACALRRRVEPSDAESRLAGLLGLTQPHQRPRWRGRRRLSPRPLTCGRPSGAPVTLVLIA